MSGTFNGYIAESNDALGARSHLRRRFRQRPLEAADVIGLCGSDIDQQGPDLDADPAFGPDGSRGPASTAET